MAELWGEELAREWKKFHPPSRPSKSELAIYDSYIRALPNDSISLLLGSTPDIRDLFARAGKKLHVIDWSEHNHVALKYLMHEKDTSKETFVNQNWCTMAFDRQFDFIIGDLALLVVTRNDSIQVMERIHASLKPGALSVQRMWIREHTEPYPLSKILELYKNKPEGEDLFSWLELPLLFHVYDYQKEECTAQHCFEVLQGYAKQNKIPKEILDTFEPFRHLNPPLNMPLKTEFEKSLKQHFTIEKIIYGSDCFSANAPIYQLRKNQ